MSVGNDLKATLSIFMQTEDFESFENVLESSRIHIILLIDPLGYNIFHDLANCLIREDLLLKCFGILVQHIQKKHFDQSSSTIIEMLNQQTSLEKQTPLLLAITHNRLVKTI
jgi:hypothetical protein